MENHVAPTNAPSVKTKQKNAAGPRSSKLNPASQKINGTSAAQTQPTIDECFSIMRISPLLAFHHTFLHHTKAVVCFDQIQNVPRQNET